MPTNVIALILCLLFCILAVAEGVERDTAFGTSSVSSVDLNQLEKKIHTLVNRERQKRGLRALSWDTTLHRIARKYSEDMARRNFFSHKDPEGRSFYDRYKAADFSCRIGAGDTFYLGAENISQDNLIDSASYKNDKTSFYYDTESRIARSVVERWMNSKGHRQNILSSYFGREGIGIALADDGKIYVTEDFC